MSSSEWKKCKLRDLTIKITKGTTPTTIGHKFVETGVNYIKAESILLDGRIDPSKFGFISLQTHEKLSRSQLEENDILFSMAGMVLGKSAVVKKDFLPANTNQALAIIRLKQEIVDPQFISYFMKQESFFNYVNYSTGQSAQPNINLEEIGDLEINLPPLSTQKWITGILSSLDEKTELNRQTNASLEAIAQAIFKEWFVDFNFPGATGEMVESELGLIPKGWRVGRLGELIEISNETVKPMNSPELLFSHYSIPSYDDGLNPIIEAGSAILSNKYLVKEKSILVSKLNPRIPRIWAINQVENENSICSTEFQVFLPIKHFYYSFSYFYLIQQSTIDTMVSKATGTSSSHQRINPNDILGLDVIIPNDELIIDFENNIREYFKYLEHNLNENLLLAKTRDSLLPKLMIGEIEL